MFHRFDFFGANVLSISRTLGVIFLVGFEGSFLKSGKYDAETFLCELGKSSEQMSKACGFWGKTPTLGTRTFAFA